MSGMPSMHSPEQLEQLFSYGSLQQERVQLSTFGRTLAATPDVLKGYRTVRIEITDRTATAAAGAEYYLDAQKSSIESDCIAGMRLDVTRHELEQADVYEASANYVRVRVRLESGHDSWLYVSSTPRT